TLIELRQLLLMLLLLREQLIQLAALRVERSNDGLHLREPLQLQLQRLALRLAGGLRPMVILGERQLLPDRLDNAGFRLRLLALLLQVAGRLIGELGIRLNP